MLLSRAVHRAIGTDVANFEVPFSADAFPGHIRRRGVLKFTSADLAHALFVTGRAPADQWAHGDASTWEWLSRSSMVPAYVREDSGRLMRSALANSLDRSESGCAVLRPWPSDDDDLLCAGTWRSVPDAHRSVRRALERPVRPRAKPA
jgi:hypothetical protein